MRAALPLGVFLLFVSTGCLGPPASEVEVARAREVHVGEEVVLTAGRLVVPEGARYELQGGALRLHDDPRVTVDGVVDVKGAFVAKDAVVSNLFRLTVHPGASLVLENTTVAGGAVPASLVLASDDVRVVGSSLHVRGVEVRGRVVFEGNRIFGDTEAPVVRWRGSEATFVGNTLETPGHGVVLDGCTGTVRGNTVRAGLDGRAVGVAVRGGDVVVEDNAVTAAVGIGFEAATGTVRGNVVRGATEAAIALVGSDATVEGNVVDGARRAGIYLEGSDARVVDNVVTGATAHPRAPLEEAGAGVVVHEGAPLVEGNRFAGNDVGVAALAGRPVVRGNDFEGNRRFGLVLADVADVDASGNWWGAPSGPVPASPTAEPPAPPGGADRVDARARYAPWSAERVT